MFLRSLQQVMGKISLLAFIFAQLAPTVSYALASHSNPNFFQEICSANNAKKIVVLQILTTKGIQLTTAITIKQQESESAPISSKMDMHFEHCPFCTSHIDGTTPLNLSNISYVAELNAYQHTPIYDSLLIPRVYQLANPSQAPPIFSIY